MSNLPIADPAHWWGAPLNKQAEDGPGEGDAVSNLWEGLKYGGNELKEGAKSLLKGAQDPEKLSRYAVPLATGGLAALAGGMMTPARRKRDGEGRLGYLSRVLRNATLAGGIGGLSGYALDQGYKGLKGTTASDEVSRAMGWQETPDGPPTTNAENLWADFKEGTLPAVTGPLVAGGTALGLGLKNGAKNLGLYKADQMNKLHSLIQANPHLNATVKGTLKGADLKTLFSQTKGAMGEPMRRGMNSILGGPDGKQLRKTMANAGIHKTPFETANLKNLSKNHKVRGHNIFGRASRTAGRSLAGFRGINRGGRFGLLAGLLGTGAAYNYGHGMVTGTE